MATITRRPNGNWQAKIRKKGLRKSKTFSTKEKAMRWARRIESDFDDFGNDSSVLRAKKKAESMTFGEAMVKYRDEYTAKKIGCGQETSKINIILTLDICMMKLSHVEPEDLKDLMDNELTKKRGLAPATIKLYMAPISHMFTVAKKEWGMKTLENPYSSVTKPKVRNHRDRRLEEGEEELLIAACEQPWKNKNPYLLPAIRFALETTLREGELVALKWKDVDFSVPKIKAKNKDSEGNNIIKHIPLSKRALAVLDELKNMPDYNPKGRIFPTTESAIYQAFVKACARACEHVYARKIGSHEKCDCKGIENLHFHDLRHEAISRLFERTNLRTEQIMTITGHKTQSQLNRYLHLRDVKVMAEALNY